MELTQHGSERIRRRTGMTERDVVELAKARIGVELGQDKQFKYLLFFSPPDQDCKIAVTKLSHDGTELLLSVWDKYYRLPSSVKRPTLKNERQARRLLHRFVAERAFKNSAPQKRQKPINVRVQILVYDAGRTAFTHEVGLVERHLVKDHERALASQHDTLVHIARIIKENPDAVKGKVQLVVRVLDSETNQFRGSYSFNPGKLLKPPQQPEPEPPGLPQAESRGLLQKLKDVSNRFRLFLRRVQVVGTVDGTRRVH